MIKERRVHIAIMRKSWGLTEKIRNGDKTIESRWYLNRSLPWNNIEKGETIYFKDSGEPISLRANVREVKQFENLNPEIVREILHKYGKADGLDIGELDRFYELFKNKKYCLLIFLENVQNIESFDIDKQGFGMMSAWLTLSDIEKIKKHNDPRFKQPSLLRRPK